MAGQIAYPEASPSNQGNVMSRANSISALVGFLAVGLATNAYAQPRPPAEPGFWARDTMTGTGLAFEPT